MASPPLATYAHSEVQTTKIYRPTTAIKCDLKIVDKCCFEGFSKTNNSPQRGLENQLTNDRARS